MSSRSTSNEKGAAEEAGPEPGDSLSSSSTAASYDPTVFQRPHPDDRAGADGTPRKKGDGKDKSKDKDKAQGNGNDESQVKAKGKKGALSLDRCGWCDTEGANKTCTQCRSVVYCSPACQKVSRSRLGTYEWQRVRDDQRLSLIHI